MDFYVSQRNLIYTKIIWTVDGSAHGCVVYISRHNKPEGRLDETFQQGKMEAMALSHGNSVMAHPDGFNLC